MGLCAFPIYGSHGAHFGCGQCMNCRINKRRQWSARLMLESLYHPRSWFVTLTYAPDQVRLSPSGLPTLVPRDLQLFLKRVRKDTEVRFFAVGEYGTRTERPHYHAILYGLSEEWLEFNASGYLTFRRPTWWPHGWVSIAEFNSARASYIAHYTTKKLTRPDPDRLGDRYPEFMRSSRRPGIGAKAVEALAELYRSNAGALVLSIRGDVVSEVRLQGSVWPLDAFMKEKLRRELEIPLDSSERLVGLPKELHPIFREISEDEQAQAVRAHDKARRKARFHGSL